MMKEQKVFMIVMKADDDWLQLTTIEATFLCVEMLEIHATYV